LLDLTARHRSMSRELSQLHKQRGDRLAGFLVRLKETMIAGGQKIGESGRCAFVPTTR
jgi:hypothetical protein